MRYSRQEKCSFIPKGFSEEIKTKNLIIVGAGGVGSVLCELLVRSGFLNLTIIDPDVIDETNLGRQIYFEDDIGKAKVNALTLYLKKIDSNVKISLVPNLLSKNNVLSVCSGSDLIIDCSDNFEVRELINSFCEKNAKDWLYTGAVKSEIICALFIGSEKKFSKIFPKKIKEESCCDVGVLASTTFTSASIAFNKIVKYFIGKKENNLIKIDLWNNKFHEVKL